MQIIQNGFNNIRANCLTRTEIHDIGITKTPDTPETPFQYHFDRETGMYLAVDEHSGVARCRKSVFGIVSKCVSFDCEIQIIKLVEIKIEKNTILSHPQSETADV
ncbi:MAG: hypothetical protein Q4E41_02375 [Bacteroidales bacterium]|nr:hypothetical protein [Bacteroidales bacterium]